MRQFKGFAMLLWITIVPVSLCIGEGLILKDDWYSPPQDIHSFQKTKIVVFPVLSEQVTNSIQMLQKPSFVEVSTETAHSLTGEVTPSGKRAFLARGLVFAFQKNGFTIYQNGTTLWVHHGVLSSSVTMRKHPVVIFLDEPPKEVIVSCSVAG